MNELDLNKVSKLINISKSINIKPSQLAILWCLKNKNVSTVILGASKLSQLKENIKSLEFIDLLTDDIMNDLNS